MSEPSQRPKIRILSTNSVALVLPNQQNNQKTIPKIRILGHNSQSNYSSQQLPQINDVLQKNSVTQKIRIISQKNDASQNSTNLLQNIATKAQSTQPVEQQPQLKVRNISAKVVFLSSLKIIFTFTFDQSEFELPQEIKIYFIGSHKENYYYDKQKSIIFTLRNDNQIRNIKEKIYIDYFTKNGQNYEQNTKFENQYKTVIKFKNFYDGNKDIIQHNQFHIPEQLKLKQNQIISLQKARQYQKFAFLDSPGLGKSLPALIFLLEKKENIILIAPEILYDGWFNTFKQLNIQIIEEQKDTNLMMREIQYNQSHSLITAINYFQLITIPSLIQQINQKTITTLVIFLKESEIAKIEKQGIVESQCSFLIDEFHQYKDLESQRTKSVLEASHNAKYIALLTATPALNDASEFFTLFQCLGLKCSNIEFKQRFCIIEKRQLKNKIINTIIGSINIDELKCLLFRFATYERYSKQQDIPLIHRSILDLSPQQLLSQNDQNNINNTNFSKKYSNVFTDKKDAAAMTSQSFAQFLQNFNEKCVIFFSNLTVVQPLEGICDIIYGKLTIKQRQQLIDKFRENKSQKLCISMDCFSFGIDLAVCKYCFFLQMGWTSAQTIQAEGRIRRISSQYPKIESVLVKGGYAIENFVQNKVEDKSKFVGQIYGEEIIEFRDKFYYHKQEQDG